MTEVEKVEKIKELLKDMNNLNAAKEFGLSYCNLRNIIDEIEEVIFDEKKH